MTWNDSIQRPTVVPGDGSQQSRLNSAIEALETAVDGHEDVAFLWTGGKEAQVIADLLLYEVGDAKEVSPVPFVTIDTGNHLPEMYDFRDKFVAPLGDQGSDTIGPPTGLSDRHVIRHDEMLKHVILNPADPRGYHGSWNTPTCPRCESALAPVTTEVDYECHECDFTYTVRDEFRATHSEDDWGVPESCGALKVVPIRKAVEEYGFDTLITGRRSADPMTPGDADDDALDVFEETRSPVPHERVNPLASWVEENVYAYIKKESVSLPSLYTEKGYRHTDAKCCVDKEAQVGEYGEGGRDPQKRRAKDRLEDMGYV